MRFLSLALLSTTVIGFLAASSSAQSGPPVQPGKPGFIVSGQKSNSAGVLCSGFSCAGGGLSVGLGEKVTFTLRSPMGSNYVILLGVQHFGTCVSYPGIGNLWAGPQLLVVQGQINTMDRLLCWGGLGTFSFNVPTNVPLGASGYFQAVVENTTRAGLKAPFFSSPVKVTVK